ncbi:3D domain-containing protein [Paenibacillus sp. GCM10023252]|uniref:3D domain-containing protein n=1 Tax=Paenibacillus sp. GCM10023252 TaxID=3252649 RepID=UPI0036159949
MFFYLFMHPNEPATPPYKAALPHVAAAAMTDSKQAPIVLRRNNSANLKPVQLASKPAAPKQHTFVVTAYSLGDGYTPSHGITASGERVREGRTLACPKSMPFGTKVYLPKLKHTYTCTDRGGAIKGKRLDIYMEEISEALVFGRQSLQVEIIHGSKN